MKPFSRLGRINATYLAMLGLSLAQPAMAQDVAITKTKTDALTFTLITGDKVSAVVNKNGELGGIRLLNADGSDAITSIFKRGKSTYVIPTQAQALVNSQSIDMELFNINKLYESGYDDASTDVLPIIVEYRDGSLAGTAVPKTFAGISLTSEIELIDSAAFAISKDKAAQAWQTLASQADVEGIWLDAIVHAHKVSKSETLTPTVPLTGAYGEAAINYNGAGIKVAVLDTGYDTEHPDLHGRVVASRDFTYSSNGVDDINGHGTHTASTVAGNGHESDGKWVGVAPGSELIIGKVLGNNGGGSTLGILNGMYWAVMDEQADIVNMSLGGTATTCSGPLVDMVEALSEKALFIISAGNSFTRETIGSPGCAPSALTVGAIDRDGNTASFSSRGPSPDGHSAKPDITSQGVSVVAAASGGLGDTAYRVYSGTSMSAPHVAGGAAIVMQARHDLTPQQIKDVLTSSVKITDSHVLEQGAGPMDINRAIDQAIIAPPNRELGFFKHTENDAFTETSVTLKNISHKDITLKLKLDLIGEDGKTQLPATLAGLAAKSITIPANGEAQVPMWIDPSVALRNGAYGAITGRITGTSTSQSNEQLIVPVSFWIDQPKVSLTVNLTDRWGNRASAPSKVYLINEEDDWGSLVRLNGGKAEAEVPAGYYTIVANIMTYDNPDSNSGLVDSAAQMAVLNRKIDSTTVIDLDARTAQQVTFKAEQPLAPQGYSFGFTYALDDEKVAKLAGIEMAPDYVSDMFAWSQGHDDRFRSFVTTRALAPETTVKMQNGVELDYIKQGLALSFHGEGSAEVVPVGDAGYSTDWSQFQLEGKIALITNPYYLTSYMVGNAMKNGAIGVIFYRPSRAGRYKGTITGTPKIPVIGISSEQGETLMTEIEAGNNMVSWSGIAAERSPYAYSINHITDGRIQSGQINITEHKMHKITASYHSQNDERPSWTDAMAMTNSTGEFYSTGSTQMIMLPHVREEYYTATTKNAWTNIVMPNYQMQSSGAYFDGPRTMTPAEEETTTWFKGPRAGSLGSSGSPIIRRDTNLLHFNIAAFGDASNHDGMFGYMGSSAFGLTLDGKPVSPYQGTLTLEPGDHQITLEVRSYARGVGERSPVKDNLGSLYQGFYTFTANEQHQGIQPVLIPMIDLPVDIENTMNVGEAAQVKLSGLLDGVGEVPLADVQFQYAYGQECAITSIPAYIYCPVSDKFSPENWVDAQIQNIDGEWIATIPNDGNSGDFVHIRTVVSDYGTSTAEQFTLRAYMLK
ncbi:MULTISPECIES: S8 family serine peptidase [unclassified Pseudoalteromonas]|uniref:S8 family serine peptidase n=1 Tax=unclassified Pseudoalteromonas TaxID=194690 RepID=UPI0014314A2B|nr:MULTISPECIES: S8 family serine peptidase [unclassified Pseudoalteromonas]MCG9708325.1 S8 family serine peptidase [Pseudoalteromonas sp. Isolate3]MCP4584766.1 S8 family serine peptidase [Pseudoalteromonas sp.]NIZ04389.1 S8 family serine peptidase [Pseudoalteromonas sp. HF66]